MTRSQFVEFELHKKVAKGNVRMTKVDAAIHELLNSKCLELEREQQLQKKKEKETPWLEKMDFEPKYIAPIPEQLEFDEFNGFS